MEGVAEKVIARTTEDLVEKLLHKGLENPGWFVLRPCETSMKVPLHLSLSSTRGRYGILRSEMDVLQGLH